MHNFQEACAKKFLGKNEFFYTASKYGSLLLIFQSFTKNDTK